MTFSRPSAHPVLVVGLFLSGILYPLLVYFGQGRVSSMTLVAVSLALIALRLFVSAKTMFAQLRIPLLFAAAGIAVLAFLDDDIAVLVYPVFVSMCLAIAFGYSLRHPPSLIERFARLRDPDLPAGAVAYCRKVTIVWTVFCLGNGSIAAATALWGSIEVWTFWNAGLSYVVLGALVVGEMIVRRQVRSQFG